MQYEIAIIGGGIHGAGIAQAAAARGYSAVLIERSGWAAGTSSRSSKLIHGGLRYLETGQLSLVYHNLRERRLLLRNAPELVHPVAFHIPVYRDTSRRPWQLRAGLGLYRLLSGFGPLSGFDSLPASGWQEDGLREEGLQRVFRYWDAQTDDQALTAAVVQSARELGAETLCPVELLSAEATQDGYQLQLNHDGKEQTCHCRVLINAAGPWINEVAGRLRPSVPQRPAALIAGAHIRLPGTLERGIYYLEAPRDRRAVFAMPWHGDILVGTTEREYHGDPGQIRASEEEIDYLRETFAHYFPTRDTRVLEAFAGLRVLPDDNRNPNRRSRDTALLCDEARRPRMIAVYGGKLTSYRHTAEQVIELAARRLGPREERADTRNLTLRPVDRLN